MARGTLAEMPTSQIELSVRCDGLADKDVLSKSDPVCVMYVQPAGAEEGDWIEAGRTEQARDTLSPEWEKRFHVDFRFEERQSLKFDVYDWDRETQSLEDQDFLGRCETTLAQVVAAKCFATQLEGGRGRGPRSSAKGTISITAEELEENREIVTLQFAAEDLDKEDFFGLSDPYYVVSKEASDGHFVVVKKGEVVMCNLNPTWKEFAIPTRDLCNNNHDRPLKIEVFDWDDGGKDDFIGGFTASLATLLDAPSSKSFPLVSEKKRRKKKHYVDSGQLKVIKTAVAKEDSFMDYIQGGMSINFSVAIDFTLSNGDPHSPTSLHFMAPGGQDNQYVTAIKAVGGIIEDYDTDKMFPALGFGAIVPPENLASHYFFLNMHPDDPYCKGVSGLLEAYQTSLESVQLYGPTNFAPVIRHVTRFAKAYADGSQYFVLMIVTDGEITDMETTIYAIIEASRLPMSIIIIGVGDEDFEAMKTLDGDEGRLRSGRIKACRDIVQFVELRKFLSRSGMWDKGLLAREVLAEVPKQLTDWAKMQGIRPTVPK